MQINVTYININLYEWGWGARFACQLDIFIIGYNHYVKEV